MKKTGKGKEVRNGNDRVFSLEVGGIKETMVEGYNFAAHRGLKTILFLKTYFFKRLFYC